MGQNKMTVLSPPLTDDEARLVRFLRCLPASARSETLSEVALKAMALCLPEDSVYDFMPVAAGVEPEKVPAGGIWDEAGMSGKIIEILRDGLEATGHADATLLGASDFDEEEVFPSFAEGATQTAHQQGSYYDYDVEFAREYIPVWRWELVRACEEMAKKRPVDSGEETI